MTTEPRFNPTDQIPQHGKHRAIYAILAWNVIFMALCVAAGLITWVILDRATAPWAQEAELRTIRIESQIERERAVTQS